MAAQIIQTIVDAFQSFLTGTASGIVDAFQAIALTENGQLSNFAIWALVFAGVGLGGLIISKVTAKVG